MLSDRMIEIGMLLVYLGVLMWIGIRAARRVKTSTDYALAGRSVPWLIILATTAATMIGGGAAVGMVSKVSLVGISAAIVTCAWHLQLIFTGLFVAPKLRGLNLLTVGDYFELKFGPLARELAVINCMIFLIGALAAQMAAIGTITNTILGVNYQTALLIGAAVTVFYSTVGGIPAVVKTDVIQFVILVFGIGIAAAILLHQNGGFESLQAKAMGDQFSLTSDASPDRSLLRFISLFVAFLLGETFVPPYCVRCFIAKDSGQAKWGVAGAGIFLLLFLPVATFTLGTTAQIDPDVQQAVAKEQLAIQNRAAAAGIEVSQEAVQRDAQQVAFPTLIRTTFPPMIAGIVIAAVVAAVMSSADSCLSCLSTVVMEDVYRRHLAPEADDRSLLRVAQGTTLATGIAATVCASYFRNIADILEFVYDFWAPAMIVPFLVAVFAYRRERIFAVVLAMIGGMLSAILWRFALGSPYAIGPALAGFAISAAVYLVALPLTSREPSGYWFTPADPLADEELP